MTVENVVVVHASEVRYAPALFGFGVVDRTTVEKEKIDRSRLPPPPSERGTKEGAIEILRRKAPSIAHGEKILLLLNGESFADEKRNITMNGMVGSIVFTTGYLNRLSVASYASLFVPVFEIWAREEDATKTVEEEITVVSGMIERALENFETAWYSSKETEARLAASFGIELRYDGKKVDAIDASTTIIQHKTAYYIHNFGRQDVHPIPPGYFGPFMEKEVLLGAADLWENCPAPFELTYQTEPTARNPTGTTKQKTVARLANEYGTLALEVIGDLSLDKSYFDVKTRVFHEAICQLRVLEPTYDKTFDEYLRVAFSDSYTKFIDYLSYFLKLDRAIGAPYIEGPSGAGKGVLVAGFSRFWGTTGPTDYERIASADFNAFKIPFIVLDEGLTMARKTSAHIRHLIATGAHTINPKGMPQYVVNGYVRVMFTANNKNVFTQITSNEDLSEDDIDAIARRFIYFRMTDDAPQWLADRNPNNQLTNSWVEDDVIAKHVLWLNENHRKNVTPGKRFIVEGESSEVHRALVTRGEKRGLVLEWLAHFSTNPKTVEQFYAVKRSEPLAKIGNGHLLINTRAIAENWTIYGESSSPLTVTMIGRILGQISSRVRLGVSGASVRYHNINFDHVLDWAGGDAQVGDLNKMRENFNREINEI